MRGYLRSPGHNYTLDAEVTSIGKGSGTNGQTFDGRKLAGAHIPLDSGRVERMHAVVERKNDENCYVIQDLNSAYGTYVNEHRVQNSAVRLTPGDVIRFGHGGVPHEFDLTGDAQDNRTTETSGRSSAGSKGAVESGYFSKQPRNSSARSRTPTPFEKISVRPDTAPTSPRTTTPPLSQLILSERSKSVPLNLKITTGGSYGSVSPRSNAAEMSYTAEVVHRLHENGRSWNAEASEAFEKETIISKDQENEEPTVETWYVSMLREKEQRLLHMGDEISRLTVAEAESKRKDSVINELRCKVAEMETNIMELRHNTAAAEKDRKILQMGDEINRLAVFENECSRKDKLVSDLRDQVASLEVDRQTLNAELQESKKRDSIRSEMTIDNASTVSEDISEETGKIRKKLRSIDDSLLDARDELDEFRQQLNIPVPDRKPAELIVLELKEELHEKEETIEKLKGKLTEAEQELKLSHGFIENLQNDVNRHEHKMTKLSISLEKSKADCRETNEQLQAMSNKFASLKEEKKHEEVVAMMERELNQVKSELKAALEKVAKQHDKLEKQGKELRRGGRQNKQYMESGKLMQQQVSELTAELTEVKKNEQDAKVEKEQNQSRLERLRSRIVQAVYTAPGAMKPEAMLQDTEILSAMQKIIDDRTEFHQQLTDLGRNVPPLTIPLDVPVEEEPLTPTTEATSNHAERKSGKGGKKSGKK